MTPQTVRRFAVDSGEAEIVVEGQAGERSQGRLVRITRYPYGWSRREFRSVTEAWAHLSETEYVLFGLYERRPEGRWPQMRLIAAGGAEHDASGQEWPPDDETVTATK